MCIYGSSPIVSEAINHRDTFSSALEDSEVAHELADMVYIFLAGEGGCMCVCVTESTFKVT